VYAAVYRCLQCQWLWRGVSGRSHPCAAQLAGRSTQLLC
jgi:hypothetical protein